MSFFKLQTKMDIFLTINSDLAITIRVTGLEKRFGLSIGQNSGTGREVLQEQPEVEEHREMLSTAVNVLLEHKKACCGSSSAG